MTGLQLLESKPPPGLCGYSEGATACHAPGTWHHLTRPALTPA
jgi:hypothetical protein